MVDVIHGSPPNPPVIPLKTQRLDQVHCRSEASTQPQDGTDVPGDLRLKEGDTHSYWLAPAGEARKPAAERLRLTTFLISRATVAPPNELSTETGKPQAGRERPSVSHLFVPALVWTYVGFSYLVGRKQPFCIRPMLLKKSAHAWSATLMPSR